jgi:uncharacterized membrane protein YqjE
LTGGAVREILNPMLAVLAIGIIFAFIALSFIALIVLAIYAFWKMRSDDFWDEQG